MKFSFSIIFILVIFSLRADSQEESATIEAPYAIEGNRCLEKTRNRWHHFEEEMKWFLVYSDPLAGKNPRSAKLSPEDKKYLAQYQALIRHLAKAQDSFLELRNAIYDGIASDLGENGDAFAIQANSLLKLTDWYTNFIQETFFPKGWNELYQNHLRTLAKDTEGSSDTLKNAFKAPAKE
jgi:hypothetical protein